MIIKIDIDAVIRDNLGVIKKIYNEKFPNDNIMTMGFYDLNYVYPKLNGGAKNFFFVEHAKEVFYDADPYPLIKEDIELLKTNGHTIFIVSHQFNYINRSLTLDWLDKNGIYYDAIAFTNEKFLINGDILVDDNPTFLENEDDKKTKLYCVKQEYNMNYKFNNNVTMVDSFHDFVCKILTK